MKNRAIKYILFVIIVFALGFICGTVIWGALEFMTLGMDALWRILPKYIPVHPLIYNLLICGIGAVIIVLITRKFGDIPIESEEVREKIDKGDKVKFKNLGIYIVATFVPIIFGGVVGPDVGLPGIMAACAYWFGTKLKLSKEKIKTLEETGFGIAINMIFMTPLAGLADSLEPSLDENEKAKKFASKIKDIVIRIFGIGGSIVAMIMCRRLAGIIFPDVTSPGLPKFDKVGIFDGSMVKWFIPIFAVSILVGLIFCVLKKSFAKLRTRFKSKIVPALIVAVALAVLGYFFPEGMFCGQTQLGGLVQGWEALGGEYLIIVGLIKIVLCCLCMNFEWRGGKMYPLVFGSMAIGFGMAAFTGVEGTFAIAICMATVFGYVERKPATILFIFLLCFPIVFLPVVYVIALIASKIPNPFVKTVEKPKEKDETKVEEIEKNDSIKNENQLN